MGVHVANRTLNIQAMHDGPARLELGTENPGSAGILDGRRGTVLLIELDVLVQGVERRQVETQMVVEQLRLEAHPLRLRASCGGAPGGTTAWGGPDGGRRPPGRTSRSDSSRRSFPRKRQGLIGAR